MPLLKKVNKGKETPSGGIWTHDLRNHCPTFYHQRRQQVFAFERSSDPAFHLKYLTFSRTDQPDIWEQLIEIEFQFDHRQWFSD